MKPSLGLPGRVVLGLVVLVLLFAGWVVWRNLPADEREAERPLDLTDAAVIARGEYLARAGNCMGCHTTRGGTPFAGGRGIETPFGTIYAPNLTPDPETGLGAWTADDFWRAMHDGRGRDGRLLYPAFPYPNYTHVTREDTDAIYAYLRSLPPVQQPRREHELRFPYSLQASLAVWRALYFTPRGLEPEADKPPAWNRGRYLVEGLGHCMACHASRDALGGALDSGGSLMPNGKWYAPSLHARHQAGVAQWETADVVALLKTGVSRKASVMGPMAEVVFYSTQYLSEDDLRAMAVYLQALPQEEPPPPLSPRELEEQRADAVVLDLGRRVYEQQCASCHGDRGSGQASAYPALAGNRAVLVTPPHNVIQAILWGGFTPTTAGNPRPYGMPPFGHVLNDQEVAAVATYIRQSWGNQAPAVTSLQVSRAR